MHEVVLERVFYHPFSGEAGVEDGLGVYTHGYHGNLRLEGSEVLVVDLHPLVETVFVRCLFVLEASLKAVAVVMKLRLEI